MIDQDTMNVAKKKQTETVKEWRKRKRMFNGVGKIIMFLNFDTRWQPIKSRDLFSTGARGAPHPWFSETPILAPLVFFENLKL